MNIIKEIFLQSTRRHKKIKDAIKEIPNIKKNINALSPEVYISVIFI